MSQLPTTVNDLVGERVVALARVLYEFQGEVDREHGLLEVRTTERTLVLTGASDGERLRVEEGAWQDPFKPPLSEENRRYVEQYGKWRWFDHSEEEGYSELVGHPIAEVEALFNQFGMLGGVRLAANGRSLWFVVGGDEDYVQWAPPDWFFGD